MKMTVQQWLKSPEKPGLHKPFPPQGDFVVGLVKFDEKEQGAEYLGTYDMEVRFDFPDHFRRKTDYP